MVFAATRPDPDRLARVAFGADWLALDPAHLARADVMDVRVRLGLYRLLVERTNPHGAFGSHDERSPFWGYASQLAWQARSGRLGATPHTIEPTSWWGACNHALSVVPYVAAMRAGLVPPLAIVLPDEHAGSMAAWRDAFQALTEPAPDDDRARRAVWRAHVASITHAVGRHRPQLRALPAAEQRFARGWVRMVDLFAPAALRTDLEQLIERGGGALPSRVLDGHALDDLARHERAAVRRIGALADRPDWRWTLELRLWRRMMRTPPARRDAEALLAGLLGKRPWSAATRAARYLL